MAFYNGDAFTNSPAGQLLINATGSAINLDATQVVAVAAFLRVINALENLRASTDLLIRQTPESLRRAMFETEDAIDVLRSAGLHPAAVAHLVEAKRLVRKAARSRFFTRKRVREAIAELEKARVQLVEAS